MPSANPLTGIMVPATNSPWSQVVDPGSAIVCAIDEHGVPITNDDRVLVYFESNRYGASNMATFVDRATIATSRLHDRAPTVAKAVVPKDEIILVAWFSSANRWIEEITPEAGELLAEWQGTTTS